MSKFDRYLKDMPPLEAASYGLPANGEPRRELIEEIKSYGPINKLNGPNLGFNFAISAAQILAGKKVPKKIIFNTSANMPFFHNVEDHKILWKGFSRIFPLSAEAMGISLLTPDVPTIEEVHTAPAHIEIAEFSGRLLVAQSLAIAQARDPEMAYYGFDPNSHVVFCFEDKPKQLIF